MLLLLLLLGIIERLWRGLRREEALLLLLLKEGIHMLGFLLEDNIKDQIIIFDSTLLPYGVAYLVCLGSEAKSLQAVPKGYRGSQSLKE